MGVVSWTNNQATALACSLTNTVTVITFTTGAGGGTCRIPSMYVSYVIAQCAVSP